MRRKSEFQISLKRFRFQITKPLLPFWIGRIFIFTSAISVYLFCSKSRLGWCWRAGAAGPVAAGAGTRLGDRRCRGRMGAGVPGVVGREPTLLP